MLRIPLALLARFFRLASAVIRGLGVETTLMTPSSSRANARLNERDCLEAAPIFQQLSNPCPFNSCSFPTLNMASSQREPDAEAIEDEERQYGHGAVDNDDLDEL